MLERYVRCEKWRDKELGEGGRDRKSGEDMRAGGCEEREEKKKEMSDGWSVQGGTTKGSRGLVS